jgi:hypothetical protein
MILIKYIPFISAFIIFVFGWFSANDVAKSYSNSLAKTTEKPTLSRPTLKPPAPENNATAFISLLILQSPNL